MPIGRIVDQAFEVKYLRNSCNILPSSTCNALEKCFRSFLWGNVENRSKPHLVNWEMVCKSKQKGGLGVCHLKDHNRALMTKLGWGLINKKDELWVKVLRDKYKCGTDMIPIINRKKSGSSVWSGIKSVWNHVNDGIEWKIGNGSSINFWKDKWIPNCEVLEKCAITNIPDGISTRKVADYVKKDGSWNWQEMECYLPRNMLKVISKVKPPHIDNGRDQVRWKWEKSGRFTVKSAFENITNDYNGGSTSWRETRKFWYDLFKQQVDKDFFELNLQDWIVWNIKGNKFSRDEKWREFFAVACWSMWKRRNERLFSGKWTPNESILIKSNALISVAGKEGQVVGSSGVNKITFKQKPNTWRAPLRNWYKMNVDGACSLRYGNGGCAGLCRNDQGQFVLGFIHNIGITDPLNAELWACILGLKTAWDHGIRNLQIETDSMEVVNSIKDSENDLFDDNDLIIEIRSMLTWSWDVLIEHIPREANKGADMLAKMSLSAGSGLHVLHSPPKELVPVLLTDSNRNRLQPVGIG